MVLQTAMKEKICQLCPKGCCLSFIAQKKKLSLLLRKCSYSISFLSRWGWLGHNCSPCDLLMISSGWHFTDTGELTKDLSDCDPFLYSLPYLGTCGNSPFFQLQLSLSPGHGHLAHGRAALLVPPADISCAFGTILWPSELKYSP